MRLDTAAAIIIGLVGFVAGILMTLATVAVIHDQREKKRLVLQDRQTLEWVFRGAAQ